MERQVQKKTINLSVKAKDPGYEITQDHLDNQLVILHFYKGKISALDLYESGRTLMFRLKIQFTGNLAKYIPIDAVAAKETIETIDLDLELLEIFFKKRETSQAVRSMFSPMVDKYQGVKIGERVGDIKLPYGVFTEFVNFIQHLAYAPFGKEVKL